MENKITLGIEAIIGAYNGVSRLLSLQGLTRKQVYWLDRNREHLMPHVKNWYTKIANTVFEKFAIDVDDTPFVPPARYQAFKKELLDKIESGSGLTIYEIFTKHEMTAKINRGIPIDKKEEHANALAEEAEKFVKEIEYNKIVVDKHFEELSRNLTGEEQLAIAFMLEEPSTIRLAPAGVDL